MHEYESHLTFTQIVIIINPVSTHAARIPSCIQAIKKICPEVPITIIETSSRGKEMSIAMLADQVSLLGPQTLLCIAGGDGTVNMIVGALLLDDRFVGDAQRTPILPLWCGNANDLACMANGSIHRTTLTHVFQNGHIVPIFPLHCTLRDGKDTMQTQLATCYVSFGASAYTAHWLGSAAYRTRLARVLPGGRFVTELVLVWRALGQAQQYAIEEDGQNMMVFERTFLNGDRMAKVSGVRVRLQERYFYMVTAENKGLMSLLHRAVEVTSSRLVERFKRDKKATFTVLEQSWAQFDGEALEISAGTQVTIEQSGIPLYIVSTKLWERTKHSKTK